VKTDLVKLEREFFRRLNSVVEPAVRRGVASSRLTPASLIVLETTGFKSGKRRRTPLWSFQLGRYRVISTARGERSLWMRNLQKEPVGNYYLGGRLRPAEALVISPDADRVSSGELPPVLAKLTSFLTSFTDRGWAFAVLVPV